MVDLGQIRRRVSFINQVPVKGSDGNWTTSESVILICWAYRRSINSQRGYIQNAQSFDNSFEYEIWYNSALNITANVIIRDDSKDYKIQSVVLLDDKKKKYRLIANLKEG